MTAEQFAYWLQGYAELNESPPTAEQWQAIRDHLALVFNKVTPQRMPSRIIPNDWYPPQELHPQPIDLTRVTCSAASDGGSAFQP